MFYYNTMMDKCIQKTIEYLYANDFIFNIYLNTKDSLLYCIDAWNYTYVKKLEDDIHPYFRYLRIGSNCFRTNRLFRVNYIRKHKTGYYNECVFPKQVCELSQMKKPDILLLELETSIEEKYIYLTDQSVSYEKMKILQQEREECRNPIIEMTLYHTNTDKNGMHRNTYDLFPYVSKFFVKKNKIDYTLLEFICDFFLDVNISNGDKFNIEYITKSIENKVFDREDVIVCE